MRFNDKKQIMLLLIALSGFYGYFFVEVNLFLARAEIINTISFTAITTLIVRCHYLKRRNDFLSQDNEILNQEKWDTQQVEVELRRKLQRKQTKTKSKK